MRFKRTIALLLSLFMIVTYMPAMAFAAETDGSTEQPQVTEEQTVDDATGSVIEESQADEFTESEVIVEETERADENAVPEIVETEPEASVPADETEETVEVEKKPVHVVMKAAKAAAAADEWVADDFTYNRAGNIITGLSDSGYEKLVVNKDLVIPKLNGDIEIKAIAAAPAVNGKEPNFGIFVTEDEKLDSVRIYKNIKKIGAKAFMNSGIKTLTMEQGDASIEEIGMAAFQQNNIEVIELPPSVSKLGEGAFATNSNLKEIKINSQTALTELPEAAFGCSDKDNYMTDLTSITIPDKITKIGARAFAGNNFSKIVVPKNVKEIGEYAFSTKNYLNTPCEVYLPEGLEKIGDYAFRNKVIEKIGIPSTVEAIYPHTFLKAYSDPSVEVLETKVFVSTEEQFYDKENFTDSEGFHKVYFESTVTFDPNGGNVETTELNTAGTKLNDAPEATKDGEGFLGWFTEKDGGEKIITVAEATEKNNNKEEGAEDIQATDIDEDITVYAHWIDASRWQSEDFTYDGITLNAADYGAYPQNTSTATLTETKNLITGFSDQGFAKIKVNPNLELPVVDTEGNAVQGVAKSAFDAGNTSDSVLTKNNVKIKSVTFPEDIPKTTDNIDNGGKWRNYVNGTLTERGDYFIGMNAFQGNELSELVIPEGVLAIGNRAFINNKITKLTIPSTIMVIDAGAFGRNDIESTDRLSELIMPEDSDFKLTIRATAFNGNDLAKVVLPKDTYQVANTAFANNTGNEDGIVNMYIRGKIGPMVAHLGGTTTALKSTYQRAIRDFSDENTDAVINVGGEAAYTGEAVLPSVSITMAGEKLKDGVDYTVEASNNVEKGEASYTINAIDGSEFCWGSKSGTFTIVDSVEGDITVEVADVSYNGIAQEPVPVVKLGEETLSPTDFDAEYSNNINVGEARVTVTLKGKYIGSASGSFNILKKKLSDSDVKVTLNPTRNSYTGEEVTPVPTVTVGSGTLKETIDYTVSYENNINWGTNAAVVVITACGDNCEGEKRQTFTIGKTNFSNSTIISVPASVMYTGEALEPEVTVIHADRELIKDTDYTVEYSNNTDIGTATVKVTPKDNYGGTARSVTFEIVDSKTAAALEAKSAAETAITEADTAASELSSAVESLDTSDASAVSAAETQAEEAAAKADFAALKANESLEAAKTAYGEDSKQAISAEKKLAEANAVKASAKASLSKVKSAAAKLAADAAKEESEKAQAAKTSAEAETHRQKAAAQAQAAADKATEAQKAAEGAETAAADAKKLADKLGDDDVAGNSVNDAAAAKSSARTAAANAENAKKSEKAAADATSKLANAEKSAAKAAAEAKTKKVTSVTVNVKTVNKKAIDSAVKKAGGSNKYVTKIILGKKVKKISKNAFKTYTKVKTLELKTKKLKKSSVKGALKGSKVKTVKVKVGSKKVNKKYVKKYKKFFTKKNAGRKAKVK